MSRRWLPVTAALLVLALVLAPPLRARLKAGPMLAEAVGLPTVRPLAVPVDQTSDELAGVPGRRFQPAWAAPGVVLVPGATPAGIEDRRVQRTAAAIARAGRTVFVPDLALYERTFAEDDLGRIATAARALAAETGGRTTLIGFSYGGSFALIAAAEPGMGDLIDRVAVFGAYYDLAGVVQAVTTGVSLVDGRRLHWDADPAADEIFLDAIARLAPRGEGGRIVRVVEGEEDPEVLSPQGRALHDLVVNDDPRRTAELVAALPEEVRDLVERFSPAAVADQITVPVLALHSVDDPAVPYAEGLRLQAGLDDADLTTVGVFRHVDLDEAGGLLRAAPDLLRSWRFAGRTIAPQEPALPATAHRMVRR